MLAPVGDTVRNLDYVSPDFPVHSLVVESDSIAILDSISHFFNYLIDAIGLFLSYFS